MLLQRIQLIAQDDSGSVISVMMWSAATLVVIILCFVGYSHLKRWMQQPEEAGALGFGFSDLRELHRQGKITDQEYETARQKMLGAAKQMTENLPDPLAGTRRTGSPASAVPPEGPPNTGG
jgi:hypothetical protein